jgi:hypothetical protein
MDPKKSHLYLSLDFLRRLENSLENPNEIYYLIYGYVRCMNKGGLPQTAYESWINEFLEFIDAELRDRYYPDGEIWTAHFGLVMKAFEKNNIEGVNIFFDILNMFIINYYTND